MINTNDPYRAISTLNPGELLHGAVEISQSIAIILRTPKGSDPMRPLFGSDINRHLDKPATSSAPLIVKEVIDQLRMWEPRVTIKKVYYTVVKEHLEFTIVWERKGVLGQLFSFAFTTNNNTNTIDFGDYSLEDYNNDFF